MDDVSIEAAAFDVATPFVPRKRMAASSAEGTATSLKSHDERTMAIPSLAPGENWTGTENADVRAGSELDDQLKGLGGTTGCGARMAPTR
jgi:hypothetical protein